MSHVVQREAAHQRANVAPHPAHSFRSASVIGGFPAPRPAPPQPAGAASPVDLAGLISRLEAHARHLEGERVYLRALLRQAGETLSGRTRLVQRMR